MAKTLPKTLLSISPEHVGKIFDGTKRYELRKTRCSKKVTEFIIYCTSPVRKVVGEAAVEEVLEGTPDEIWTLTSDAAGIDRTFFDTYYSGKNKAMAFRIGRVRKFEKPRDLSDYGLARAPQPFAYLTD